MNVNVLLVGGPMAGQVAGVTDTTGVVRCDDGTEYKLYRLNMFGRCVRVGLRGRIEDASRADLFDACASDAVKAAAT